MLTVTIRAGGNGVISWRRKTWPGCSYWKQVRYDCNCHSVISMIILIICRVWHFGFKTYDLKSFRFGFHVFLWYRYWFLKKMVLIKVSVSVSKKISIEKSIGIGFGKFWYQKSIGIGFKKNWNRKKYRYRLRKFLVSKKVSVSKKIAIGKKFRIWFRSDFGFRHTLA